jgi:diguanylate cyclase (GGDEF)-like protein/PAS domain S-box-containing protein
VLYLTSSGTRNLLDRTLLNDIGGALGLSLDNMRQKELLLQKEGRLRSVITGAPIVLFSVNNAGVVVFHQGQAMEQIGVDPETLIGRPVTDIYANYPAVLQSFRRAFAGDEVISTATIEANGNRVIFEYRLAPEKDEHGRVTGVIGVATDITQRKLAADALREGERFLTTLVANLPGFVIRLEGSPLTIKYVSEGVREITGFSAEDLTGQPIMVLAERLHEDDRLLMTETVRRARETGHTIEYEFRFHTRSGEERWFWQQGQVVTDEDGLPIALEMFTMDITDRKRATDALEASEERFRDIYENARDAMVSFDFRGHFLSVNRRMVELFGYTEEEFLELSPADLTPVEAQAQNAEYLQRVFRGDSTPFEVELIARDGHRVPMEMTARIALDEKGRARTVQMIGRDISERKQAEETIRRLAYHDSLTGLPNRALFEDRLRMALAQARRQGEMLGVLFLDVDSFKLVNDTLGHSAGDKLLQSVANDLSALIREGDTVARVGGDEFTLLLPTIERTEDVTDVAQRILECLRLPRIIAGQEFRATASIGITTFPADGEDGEALLRNADTAMYRAKEHGRDNYQLYTAAMNQRVMDRLSFEQSLRQSLARNELKVFYQPIIDIETGRITAAEALVRWFHPTRGIIMPDEFIPLAEETGIILEIGEVVLREVCRQIKEWRNDGVEIGRVAVNLSARQMQQEDLVSRVARILQESGVSPSLIQLEITEGAVLKNVDYAIGMLHQLREMGIGIALDDFGTGYSSLTYLKRFPVDAVKVDRTFVRDLEHDANDATIVSTVIGMADNLGLRVIAEGVETEQQLAFLRARGCTEFQGYLFSPPVPPDEFATLVTNARIKFGANGGKTKSGKALPAA